MDRPILSVIISTHDRRELLIGNLCRMLRVGSDDIEFIVCDNGSTDDTWSELSKLSDPRLKKLRNTENYGFDNFWLTSFAANAPYFMFINDRDYICCPDLEWICEQLRQIEQVDLVSCDRGDFAVGYYPWKDAITLYFQSRHPGTLIYSSGFCRRVLKKEVFLEYLTTGRPQCANNYLVFQLLLNVTRIYALSTFLIVQPENREEIKKQRKEYYGSVYISPEYRIRDYHDWLAYAKGFSDNERTGCILRAIYKDSLRTVTLEYFYSLRIPRFRERNDCKQLRAGQWFANGIRFCREFYRFPSLPDPDMRRFFLRETAVRLLKTAMYVSLEPARMLKRTFRKGFRLWTI